MALAARRTEKLGPLAAETGAGVHGCDATAAALFLAVPDPEIVAMGKFALRGLARDDGGFARMMPGK